MYETQDIRYVYNLVFRISCRSKMHFIIFILMTRKKIQMKTRSRNTSRCITGPISLSLEYTILYKIAARRPPISHRSTASFNPAQLLVIVETSHVLHRWMCGLFFSTGTRYVHTGYIWYHRSVWSYVDGHIAPDKMCWTSVCLVINCEHDGTRLKSQMPNDCEWHLGEHHEHRVRWGKTTCWVVTWFQYQLF